MADDSVKKSQETAKALEKTAKTQENVAKRFKKSSKEIVDEITFIGDSIHKLNKKMDEYGGKFKVFKSVSGNFKNLEKGVLQLSDDLDKLGIVSSDSFNKILKETNTVLQNFKKMNEASNKFKASQNKSAKDVETYNKVLSENMQNFGKDIARINDKIGDFTKKFKESSTVQSNLKDIQATYEDMADGINRKAASLNLFPEDMAVYLSKIEENQKKIYQYQQDLFTLNQEIANTDAKDVAILEEKRKKLKEINKNINDSSVEMKEASTGASTYLGALEKYKYQDYGLEKWKGVQDNIFRAKFKLDDLSESMKKSSPFVSGLLEKFSKGLGKVGTDFKNISSGLSLMSTGVSLLKYTSDLEQKNAKVYKSISESGLLIGKSSKDVESSMDNIAFSTLNIKGLLGASSGKEGFFSIGQEDILDTASGLNEVGVSSRKLEGQMKSLDGVFSGGLKGATEVVKTFSYGMGVSESEVRKMMGNMQDEFGTTIKSMAESMTGISNAIDISGMSQVRFLGILGTSTAGMTLYAEQVEETARVIAKLAQKTSMSQKEIENFTTGAMKATQDSDNLAKSLGLIPKAYIEQIAASLGDTSLLDKKIKEKTSELEKTKSKSKGTPEDVKRIKEIENDLQRLTSERTLSLEASEALNRGDIYSASKVIEGTGAENRQLIGAYIQKGIIEKSSTGKSKGIDKAITTQVLNDLGGDLTKSYEELFYKVGGNTEKIQKELNERIKAIKEGKGEIEGKSTKDIRDKAAKESQKVEPPTKKLEDAIINGTNLTLDKINGSLKVIAGVLVAKGLFDSIKGIYGLFKGGGLGGVIKNLIPGIAGTAEAAAGAAGAAEAAAGAAVAAEAAGAAGAGAAGAAGAGAAGVAGAGAAGVAGAGLLATTGMAAAAVGGGLALGYGASNLLDYVTGGKYSDIVGSYGAGLVDTSATDAAAQKMMQDADKRLAEKRAKRAQAINIPDPNRPNTPSQTSIPTNVTNTGSVYNNVINVSSNQDPSIVARIVLDKLNDIKNKEVRS